QSEAGAAGAVHGALQTGALSTTFTASQGLLLMIPNLYKIAGELTSFCMHVTARTIATHALSIFGDHSDVMACRQTGMAMLASGSSQEAQDMACIGQASTLRARVPFMHFFDGFRTSHQIDKLEYLHDEELDQMIDPDLVAAHRKRALTPDDPVVRGTSQNPDTFFQMQEARNPYYAACPDIVQGEMDRFAEITGRSYKLFEYFGADDAERVIVTMGSSGETVHETVDYLNQRGAKLGVIKVHLFRPFSLKHFAAVLPASVKSVGVLDRTKEHGALGEPLYQDIVTALAQAKAEGLWQAEFPTVIGGRYGLSSKEFTAAMAKAVFDELAKDKPKTHFTVGIIDDVTRLSLDVDEAFSTEGDEVVRSVFFGLGSDGTVGANKNSIKILSENTENYAQGYFVYDSKKAGSMTISHLRVSPNPIRSAYLIAEADTVACHQFNFLEQVDVLKYAKHGGILLLNSPYGKDNTWDKLPRNVQEEITRKDLKVYVVDAHMVAFATGMGRRINTIMQTCFFAISGIIPKDEAIDHIKTAIRRTYTVKGHHVVDMNNDAVDQALDHLHLMEQPGHLSREELPPMVPDHAPNFVKQVTAMMLAGKGDMLPVSALPADGTWPVGTTKWEKRNLAQEIPTWIPELCIQCNKCALVCPHAAIRVKAYGEDVLVDAPETFQSMKNRGKEFGDNMAYTVQIAPEDCTGCTLCVRVCPGKDKANPDRLSLEMMPQPPLVKEEHKNWEFFLNLPEIDRTKLKPNVKLTQFAEPLFEFSGACSGCGETPYIKLITQMYGDRSMIANATGCSSIFGGNLPATPWTKNLQGRGPAWANSLFEDNAEFGLGFRLALDKHVEQARAALLDEKDTLGEDLTDAILEAEQLTETDMQEQRKRVQAVKDKLGTDSTGRLSELADYLVRKDVWIMGGDGWAYDIGSGGLDHVLASGKNVNILVLDTEVYSNTGGQQSKATPMGAVAKFVTGGKSMPKKDLGLMAISYGHVYVASVAFGASDSQLMKAVTEASSFEGTSLIIANAPCIEHGYDLANELDQMKMAVDAGYWMLYRYDPRRLVSGQKPMQLDSKAPSIALDSYFMNENRFRLVKRRDPNLYEKLLETATAEVRWRRTVFEKLAEMSLSPADAEAAMQAAE
ncbi:MAG: pyruvate:ferredoxin (flavodoxin) oxidoreductase, partial [Rhodospirillaceae bacterium]|nr:pyruvate:ferredoxin (flavodoxin) oxidoreductase [Rhodospirillaceae bacterium]